jgi:UDP-N-acetylglucosamine diphosphorylase/glucosamine-1-phosphate N-acetyltransferase
MQIIVFEDRRVDQLYPITIGRAAYNVCCGSYRLVDWLAPLSLSLKGKFRGVVRTHLAEIQKLDFPDFDHSSATSRPTLLVNARLIPTVAAFESLKKLAAAPRPTIVRQGESIVAAVVDEHPSAASVSDFNKFNQWLESTFAAGESAASQQGASQHGATYTQLVLADWPHDYIRHNMETLSASLQHRLAGGMFREVSDGVFAADGVVLGQYVVSDTKQGPIVLDHHATVGPYTFLRGPIYVGPKVKIIEHSAIKDFVSVGHTVKLGGEVEASIIEPYTNKQHHGFLGHSYLGSWINLGAGTCNSDLKNTYGHVKMEYRGQSVATGMQFVGCVMGDYAKSAINTGIFTGKTVGACSMMYGFITTNVPSFVNYARLFGQVTELTPEVMIATQQRMFARRNVTQRPADAQLIQQMYELTRHERQLANEPLSL